MIFGLLLSTVLIPTHEIGIKTIITSFLKKKKRSFFSSTIKSNRGKQEEEARSLKRRKRKRLMNEMKSVRTKTKGEPLL